MTELLAKDSVKFRETYCMLTIIGMFCILEMSGTGIPETYTDITSKPAFKP